MIDNEIKGIVQDCKIADEVQSYNLMHNPKYLAMKDLGLLLDSSLQP